MANFQLEVERTIWSLIISSALDTNTQPLRFKGFPDLQGLSQLWSAEGYFGDAKADARPISFCIWGDSRHPCQRQRWCEEGWCGRSLIRRAGGSGWGPGFGAPSCHCQLWANQHVPVSRAPRRSGRACPGRGGARPRGAEQGGGDSGSRAHFLLPAAPGPHPISTCGARGARPSGGGCWACTYQTGSPWSPPGSRTGWGSTRPAACARWVSGLRRPRHVPGPAGSAGLQGAGVLVALHGCRVRLAQAAVSRSPAPGGLCLHNSWCGLTPHFMCRWAPGSLEHSTGPGISERRFFALPPWGDNLNLRPIFFALFKFYFWHWFIFRSCRGVRLGQAQAAPCVMTHYRCCRDVEDRILSTLNLDLTTWELGGLSYGGLAGVKRTRGGRTEAPRISRVKVHWAGPMLGTLSICVICLYQLSTLWSQLLVLI